MVLPCRSRCIPIAMSWTLLILRISIWRLLKSCQSTLAKSLPLEDKSRIASIRLIQTISTWRVCPSLSSITRSIRSTSSSTLIGPRSRLLPAARLNRILPSTSLPSVIKKNVTVASTLAKSSWHSLTSTWWIVLDFLTWSQSTVQTSEPQSKSIFYCQLISMRPTRGTSTLTEGLSSPRAPSKSAIPSPQQSSTRSPTPRPQAKIVSHPCALSLIMRRVRLTTQMESITSAMILFRTLPTSGRAPACLSRCSRGQNPHRSQPATWLKLRPPPGCRMKMNRWKKQSKSL